MKKLITSLLAVSSLGIAVAPVQAQQVVIGEEEITCPLGQAPFNGSCFDVDTSVPATDEFTITAEGVVTHECSIDNPGTIQMFPAFNPNTGQESMEGRAQIPFTQSSDTRWELSNIETVSPSYRGGNITITPPIGAAGRFGIGRYEEGALVIPSRSDITVITGDGTFNVVAAVNGDDRGNLTPGNYRVSAVLSCYASGSAVVGE